MKQRFNLIQLITLVFLLSLFVILSCKKENSQNGSPSQQEEQASLVSSQSDGEAEMIFNNVFDDAMGVSDQVGMSGTGVFGRGTGRPGDINGVTACFTVTVTATPQTIFPVQVLIDFGTVGCTGADGHARKGKITIEYTNRLITPGAIASATFDGYYVDSIQVEGTYKITNASSPVTTLPLSRQFIVDVIDAKLSKPNGNYTQWNSHKTITQTDGLATPVYPRDDIFEMEGSSRGQVKSGALLVAWDANITDPLVKRFNCSWIVKGTVKTVRANNSANNAWVAVLDFGSGDCDRKAIITINGVSHEIILH
jgi:hypothetical protein